jgi:ubiquinone/menaquinone biosynthesis C-methylase UbiE
MFRRDQEVVAYVPPEVREGRPLCKYPFFPESAHAHKWLDLLAKRGKGIEIGGSAHNDFFIDNMINVDYTDEETEYKKEEIRLCGRKRPVDVVAFANNLPFPDSEFDFLLNSHVFEHIPNSINCLSEWCRVVKPLGFIYTIIPHPDALDSDKNLEITTIEHHLEDYAKGVDYETHPGQKYSHYHIYNYDSYFNLIEEFNRIAFPHKLKIIDSLEKDDKVGNGFAFVHMVIK